MADGYSVAVVGATGAVGREILRTLVQRDFPIREITALASPRSAGQEVSFGERVLKVRNLETFDFEREPVSHSAFGHGIHRCVGAELARMELRQLFPAVFARFPDLRPTVPLTEVAFREYSVVHGVDALPVTW